MPEHRVPDRTALLVASGDLRQSANEACWPAQRDLEVQAAAAFAALGWKLLRAHPAPDGIELWEAARFAPAGAEGTEAQAGGPHHWDPRWGTDHGFISS
jgi:hypothetical protein